MDFLQSITLRSPQYDAMNKDFEAARRGFRMGLAPADPHLNVSYYLTQGPEIDFNIQQTFDFPTVYHQRNKLSKLNISRAEQELWAERRALMGEVSDAYLQLCYAVKRAALMEQRAGMMNEVAAFYQKAMRAGKTDSLTVQSAKMSALRAEADRAASMADRDEALAVLAQLNGGEPVPVAGYPRFMFTGTADEFVNAALALDYDLQAASIDTLIAARTLKLNRQLWIPKLTAGYTVEKKGNDPLTNIVQAGISIPLWERSGSTRYAKALRASAEAGRVATEQTSRVRLQALYARYRALDGSLALFSQQDQDPASYVELLLKSFDAGKINSVEYLVMLDDQWLSFHENQMALELEVATLAATMALCLY